jgi:hypothetical protein
MQSLKKTLMWNKDRRRTENTLRLDILEAKGLTDKKKKYYVEILVDDKLYARTASKKLADLSCCFWGEQVCSLRLPFFGRKIIGQVFVLELWSYYSYNITFHNGKMDLMALLFKPKKLFVLFFKWYFLTSFSF